MFFFHSQLWLILCADIEVMTTKKELFSVGQTTIVDQDGNKMNSFTNHWIKKDEIPDFLLGYIEKEKSTSQLSSTLYPSQPIKRYISQQLMDRSFSEERIQEVYVNKMYFNNGIVGLHNAAHYYFNKDIGDTTKLEQILLLFMSRERQFEDLSEAVLSWLIELENQGYIEKAEQQKMQLQLPGLIDTLKNPNTISQSFIQEVIKESNDLFDLTEEEVFRKGFTIRTTLDRDVQKQMYEIFKDVNNFPTQERAFIEAGGVIMEEHTGEISALMGGRYYHTTTFNRATDTTRQPASTFKPLMEFAPAIELGWKPSDPLKDLPMRFGEFKPKNYDRKFRKEVTLEEALVHSYNVPAVWLLYKIGLDTGIHYMNKFDLFTINREDGYGLALGYTSVGTSPLSMAQAYTIFPNEGKMVKAFTIEEIESKSGRTFYRSNQDQKRIIKKKSAKAMLPLLQEVVERGTADDAQIKGQKIAGKTGTTSYDGWFVGFNHKYVGAFWIGPDEVVPENRMIFSGGEYPAALFSKILSKIE